MLLKPAISKKHRYVKTTKNNKTFINMNIKNDECYTRKEEADRLVKFIVRNKILRKSAKIWLPFNDYKSNIYLSLKEHGFHNLIATKTDFYLTNVKYDIIISNPPFYNRSKLFNRLMKLNKPFILLQPIMFFNNGTCIKMLIQHGAKFGAISPKHRMSFNFGFCFPKKSMGFIVNQKEYKSTSAFYSFWLTYKTKICGFVDIEK